MLGKLRKKWWSSSLMCSRDKRLSNWEKDKFNNLLLAFQDSVFSWHIYCFCCSCCWPYEVTSTFKMFTSRVSMLHKRDVPSGAWMTGSQAWGHCFVVFEACQMRWGVVSHLLSRWIPFYPQSCWIAFSRHLLIILHMCTWARTPTPNPTDPGSKIRLQV